VSKSQKALECTPAEVAHATNMLLNFVSYAPDIAYEAVALRFGVSLDDCRTMMRFAVAVVAADRGDRNARQAIAQAKREIKMTDGSPDLSR